MTTRADIIAEARSWVKTPIRHQGRLKGIACDCVGVIMLPARACGLFPPDFEITGYPRHPDAKIMKRMLQTYLDPVSPAVPIGGDVLRLCPNPITRIPHHLAIYTFDNSIIHAYDERRGVREHILDHRWSNAISEVWRYRGLVDP